MPTPRARVGVNGRNHAQFPEEDYELIRRARIETLKTVSVTQPAVYERLRRENPNLEFIVRLRDDRMGRGHHPAPDQFVARMAPIINTLQPYVTKFEIHNEPNHADRLEGWGPSDQDAKSFLAWYLQVLSGLRQACPWASFGFPGLALQDPHRDLEWLTVCRQAILASDWLGCHCYWQQDNMLSDEWGLRFKLYHQRFPDLPIEITEFGDSTPNRPRDQIASLYTRYYQELFKYSYVRSASGFIASSHDPGWQLFVWRTDDGEFLPVVDAVGNMARPGVAPPPDPDARRREQFFSETETWIRGTFYDFVQQHGLEFTGYPITDQFAEGDLQSQYFQRLGIEEIRSGRVRLKALGTEALQSRQAIDSLAAELDLLRSRPPSSPSAPPIHDLVESLPHHPIRRYEGRPIQDLEWIVVHHTATPADVTPQRLAAYHVNTLGRPGISYHFVLAADGTIYQTNRLATAAQHASGRNSTSVGVCFVGDFTASTPTEAQLQMGGQLIAYLLDLLGLDEAQIVGVCEFTDSSSPGDQWLAGGRWKDLLLQQVRAAQQPTREGSPDRLASLHAQIESHQSTIERLQAENQAFQAAAQAPSDGRSEELARLQAQLESHRATIERLQTENQALQATALPSPELAATPTPEPAAPPAAAPAAPATPEPAPASDGRIAAPPIEVVVDALPRHKTKQYATRSLSAIQNLVIHHTAVPATVSLEKVAAYHVNSQGWPGVGYHFYISADGAIQQCNHLTTVSYHAAGINTRSVGISFAGNFTSEPPPASQIQGGARLLAWLLQELELPLESVQGHREFMDTQCPGNQWLSGQRWKDRLYAEIRRVQEEATRPPAPPSRPLYHYLLFRQEPEPLSKAEFWGAENYIAHFHPTAGFSVAEAMYAQYVTIVGGPSGISHQDEDRMQAAGCKVERIAGTDESETQQLLDKLVEQNRRFQNFEG